MVTVAAFKSEFPYQKLKMISYRNYKHFDRNNFEKEIKNKLLLHACGKSDINAATVAILNYNIFQNDEKVAKTLNSFFENAFSSLKLN